MTSTVLIHDKELFYFYNRLREGLTDEFQLLFKQYRGTYQENRKRLKERIFHGAGAILGAVAGQFVTLPGLDTLLENAAVKLANWKRDKQKSRLLEILFNEEIRALDDYIHLMAYEVTLTWYPALLWLRDRLKNSNQDIERINSNFSSLGYVASLRIFEYYLEDPESTFEPIDAVIALQTARHGKGYTSFFENVIKHPIYDAKLTYEGFFRDVCFVYNQTSYIKREFADDDCNKNGLLVTLYPKYGFVQLTDKNAILKNDYIKQSSLLKIFNNGPANSVKKRKFLLLLGYIRIFRLFIR